MAIVNAQSEYIDIFPISIDRMKIGDKVIYLRKEGYANLPDISSLSETEKTFVKTNIIIDSASFDNKYIAFYDQQKILQTSSYHNGRALTEENISSIFRKLTDKTSYVIAAGSDFIEFMIKGHYFKLTDSTLLDMNPLYVGATFKSIGTDYEQLDGYDYVDPGNSSPSKFLGLNFSSEPQDYDENDLNLEILQLLDESGNIPTESKFRFTENVVKNINGGTV